MVRRGAMVAAAVLGMTAMAWAQEATTRTAQKLPRTAGHHRLRFVAQVNGEVLPMAYALYLPGEHGRAKEPMPVMTFLVGAGECGDDHAGLFVHGPAAEFARAPKLAEGLGLIVLTPQCPKNRRWEEPQIIQATLQLSDYVIEQLGADRRRQYLTGLSMGGRGTWELALADPGRYAAIAPISGVGVDSERAARLLKGTGVWIIVGGADGGFLESSRQMARALKAGGVDVVLTEVPGSGHDTWARFYPQRKFYEHLLSYTRGRPPGKQRLSEEQLLAIGYTPPPEPLYVKQFKAFAPYWHLHNCGPDMEPGLHDEWGGRKNVFVTHPAGKDVPCMLQITWPVPAQKRTRLVLTVGHHPDGDWRLVVRADGKDLLVKEVDKASAPAGWMDVEVDLSAYAGREVRLELLNAATGWAYEAGYWAKVAVESK